MKKIVQNPPREQIQLNEIDAYKPCFIGLVNVKNERGMVIQFEPKRDWSTIWFHGTPVTPAAPFSSLKHLHDYMIERHVECFLFDSKQSLLEWLKG